MYMNYSNKDYIEHLRRKYPPGTRLQLSCMEDDFYGMLAIGGAKAMTERKVKLDRANKSILLRALGDVYYGQRARGGSAEETGRLILRVNDLPAGGKLTMSAAEYRLAKAALNQLRTQRLAEGGYTDAVDDALTRLLHAHTPLFIW